MLRELGFSSVGGLENALANQQTQQFQTLQKLVLDALQRGTIQTVEYAYKDVYYRLSALFITKRQGRAMILMRLNTFEADREVETAREMLNSSRALMSTYELVVLFFPERKKAKRIHTSNNLPEYDREDSFQKSLQRFCETEIDPVDQERYMRFLDFETLEERIGSNPRLFIQSIFRMRLDKDRPGWYSARVTQIKRLFENGIDNDLVIFEARSSAFEHLEEIGLIVEQRGCPLLLIVDESNVDAVKFPVGIACDFVMHGAGQVECSARVRRLLGDSGMDTHMDVAVIDDMVINFATYQVTVADRPVDLTYLEYALLAFLVQHTDRTFSRDMLLQNIWGFDYRGGSRTVDVHIRRIRSKLGPKLAQYMKTVRGVGYHWSSS